MCERRNHGSREVCREKDEVSDATRATRLTVCIPIATAQKVQALRQAWVELTHTRGQCIPRNIRRAPTFNMEVVGESKLKLDTVKLSRVERVATAAMWRASAR